MQPQQKLELIKLSTYIALAALAGLVFGHALLFVAITLLLYSLMQIRNMFRLHNWLLAEEREPPDARGYWGEIFNQIFLVEKSKRKNRRRLKKILSRFQNAAQVLPYGTIILTKANDIEWVNRSACTMLGIRSDRDTGQKIYNLIRNPRFQAYLNERDYSQSIVLPRPSQPEHKLEIQIIPFGSKQKLILCRDVTHVAQLEAMRTRFISNVSHELRSPLTVIKGYVELLLDPSGKDKLSDYQKKVAGNMSEQVDRMDRLVEDLLTLTRLETESLKPSVEVAIPSMLAALRDNAEVLGKDKQQKVILEVDNDLNLVGDSDEFTSLFSNLINNAVRYTPSNGEIRIKWFSEHDNAVFSVSDTGPGIEREHISHLTERFYRVDSDRSRETGGTGLGLSIVKHVLDRHDGQLSIDSTPGKGSTFTCRFPVQRVVRK